MKHSVALLLINILSVVIKLEAHSIWEYPNGKSQTLAEINKPSNPVNEGVH